MLSPPPAMREALQAAGHPGCQQGNGVFTKPCVQQEVDFYAQLLEKDSPLLAVVPVFMGTLMAGVQIGDGSQVIYDEGAQNAAENTIENSIAVTPSDAGALRIVLRDELTGFTNPTIADMKLGFQLWDAQASPAKKQRLETVANSTTSGSLGFRIAGMSVVQPDGSRKPYDKQFGREPSKANVGDYLAHLFPQLSNEYVQAVIESMIQQIEYIISCLRLEPTKMHSCSLLLVYEGNLAELKRKVDNQSKSEPDQQEHENQDEQAELDSDDDEETESIVSAKLIDFAHSTLATEPDTEVISGLQNLSQCLARLIELN